MKTDTLHKLPGRKLRLSAQNLRSLELHARPSVASKGEPCYSIYCSAGEPCGTVETCP
jgi:hypothetical protein